MSEFNPYAAPETDDEYFQQRMARDALYFVGDTLVVRKYTDLPDICVFTGETGNNRYVRKTFTWAPNWVIIVFILNWLIGLIVYLIIRKTAKVGYFVSEERLRSRMRLILINWGIFLLGLSSIYFSILFERTEIIIGCPVLLVTSLIFYFVKLRGPRAAWIDQHEIGIKGISFEVANRMIEAATDFDVKP